MYRSKKWYLLSFSGELPLYLREQDKLIVVWVDMHKQSEDGPISINDIYIVEGADQDTEAIIDALRSSGYVPENHLGNQLKEDLAERGLLEMLDHDPFPIEDRWESYD